MLDFLINNSPLFYFVQSLWRDEVYSIFVAQRPIASFIGHLSFEPPLYYILLHFWMKIFGTGEIATRSLSFLAFLLATVLVVYFAENHYQKRWLWWFVPVFFFLNPMLLYYAFEVRTYGWYIFFATASSIMYLEKKWKWYVLVTTLGFYTHTYMVIVPFVQLVHYIATNIKQFRKINLQLVKNDPMIRSLFVFSLFITPWMVIVLKEISRLKQSWYFPVDLNLVRSVLGNMFIGYEGTPWYGWPLTRLLSVIFLGLAGLAYLNNKRREINSYFLMMIFIPLTIVIGISFIKPLFVNRYLIPVTIAEVFIVIGAIESIRSRLFQTVAAASCLIFVIGVNVVYPKLHPKTPSRDAMTQINALWDNDDVVLATSTLVLFEAQYYSNDPSRVYLYNPSGSAFPWYVGDFIVDQKHITGSLPVYPSRAFLIHDNGTFDVGYRIISKDTARRNGIR